MANEWPAGHRSVHHRFDAARAQRDQSLAYRGHHTDDAHTVDGLYAAIDEAHIRLDAIERPTLAALATVHRGLAAARAIRRQYVKEANWLVANNSHLPYQHLLRLYTRWPDQYDDPGTKGLVLTDDDKARIGPTDDDVENYAYDRVDRLRPRSIDLWIGNAAGRVPASVVGARDTRILQERRRVKLIQTIGRFDADADVRDDFWTPAHWPTDAGEAHTAELREYALRGRLGDPSISAAGVETPDTWHALGRTALAATPDDQDLIAGPTVLAAGRANVADHPDWPSPPALPTVVVAGGVGKLVFSWSDDVPNDVSTIATVVVAKDYEIHHTAELRVRLQSSQPAIPRTGRCAVLVQFQRNVAIDGVVEQVRTPGTLHVVTVT